MEAKWQPNKNLNRKFYREEQKAQLPQTFLVMSKVRRETGNRGSQVDRTEVGGWVPGNLACRQYLNVVYRFGRRNGSKLSVVKLLFRQGLKRCRERWVEGD